MYQGILIHLFQMAGAVVSVNSIRRFAHDVAKLVDGLRCHGPSPVIKVTILEIATKRRKIFLCLLCLFVAIPPFVAIFPSPAGH